jgi:DNA-binding response OmpR family regulator
MSQETILIMDDNKEMVSALSDVLKSRGYLVLSAHDGRHGLRLALERKPDLILLDWNLPQLSGFQVLHALRDRGNEAPVILTALYGSESVAGQAFQLGIRDHIPKPLRVVETLNAIERALAEDRLRREKDKISRELEETNRLMEEHLLELATLQAIGQSVTSVLELEKVLAGWWR